MKLLLALLMATCTAPCMEQPKKHLILPIEGCLFKANYLNAIGELGWSGTASAVWASGWSGMWNTIATRTPDQTTMIKRIFALLSELEYTPDVQEDAEHEEHHTVVWRGLQAPTVLVHGWMQGNASCKDLLALTKSHIDQHAGLGEAASLSTLTTMIFDPEKNAKALKPIPGVIKLLKKLRKKNITLHIADNWNSEAFEELKKQNPKIFEHINGHIFLSGHETAEHVKAKEDCKFHEEFFAKYQDVPQEHALFIEIEKEHIEPLKQTEINHVLCEHGNVKTLRNSLKEVGVLTK